MSTFKIHKEKLGELTLADITDLGWKKVKDDDFLKDKDMFEKDNYIMVAYTSQTSGPVIDIIAKDPSLITWIMNPERFRICLPCPTKEAFQLINTLLSLNQ